MKSLCQLGIVILWLASYLTPAMACTVSSVPMNAEERACCQTMQDHCEQMGMQPSHGCCQKVPQSVHENALATKATAYHSVADVAVCREVSDWFHPLLLPEGLIEHPSYSPPQSPPGFISILRI